MACSEVKLACCRLCGKAIASDLGACIHCGVCKPIKKDVCSWLQRALVTALIAGTILATLRYDPGSRIEPDCRIEEIGRASGC